MFAPNTGLPTVVSGDWRVCRLFFKVMCANANGSEPAHVGYPNEVN
jgi:hypothetical protein